MQKPNASAFTAKSNRLERELFSPVQISPALVYLSEKQRLNPPVVQLSAIWDTGAMRTVLTTKVIQKLGIKPISTMRIMGATGEGTCNVYDLDLILPNNIRVSNLQIAEVANLGNHDGLIGMDIIGLGDFAVSNVNGKTWFSFIYPPNGKGIDFIDRIHSAHSLNHLQNSSPGGNSIRKTSRRR